MSGVGQKRMPDTETRMGDWLLLFVQAPGRDLAAAGVLLLDPKTNELSVKVGKLPYEDEDIGQIWEFLPEDIEQQSREFGGAQVLHSFEQTWSNTFQIGERHPVRISNPQHTLTTLFDQHVGSTASVETSSRVAAPPRITRNELLQARKQLAKSPAVVGRALQAIRSERMPTAQIADIISEEPVIAAHLIKLANSALHQHRRGEMRSVAEAIDWLGSKTVERQIVSACVRPLFTSADLREVWNHSIDVANACGQLATLMHYPEPEAALLTGLVHDIGRIVFAALGPPLRRQGAFAEKLNTLWDAEQQLYGVSHSEVGADLLGDWNFPSDMVEAVRHHHQPQNSQESLCPLLHLAESWVPSQENEDLWRISDHAEALQRTKLSPRYFLSLRSVIDADLASLRMAA